MAKKSFTEDVVYCFVCNNPGMSTYVISKKLGITGGSVRYALSKLKKMKLVKFRFDKKDPRTRKLTYPIDAWRLLPRRLRGELKIIYKGTL